MKAVVKNHKLYWCGRLPFCSARHFCRSVTTRLSYSPPCVFSFASADLPQQVETTT